LLPSKHFPHKFKILIHTINAMPQSLMIAHALKDTVPVLHSLLKHYELKPTSPSPLNPSTLAPSLMDMSRQSSGNAADGQTDTYC
jgi:hypothetical protein